MLFILIQNSILKVPGRMGMIVTLYLISANVYNSVDAPQSRGFSYIEYWMLITIFPIALALEEYGLILLLKRIDIKSEKGLIKKIDFTTMTVSLILFLTFAALYWVIVTK